MRNHLSAAIGKTGARTRADAVRIAEERGWRVRPHRPDDLLTMDHVDDRLNLEHDDDGVVRRTWFG